jgi:glycine/D-amino acid oxidase-like deaminating enzyme
MVHYYRTTRDGRIAFGRGGEAHALLGRVSPGFEDPGGRIARTERAFRTAYPSLADVPLTHRWTGAVDRSETNLPFFGRLGGDPRLLYGVGFSGNGVGQTLVGARILASSALGRDDEWSAAPLNRGPRSRFPPDPVRYAGGLLVRAAVRRKEAAEDRGVPAGPLTRAVAALAPAGMRKGGVRTGGRRGPR